MHNPNIPRPNDGRILKNCTRRIEHVTEEITNVETGIGRQTAVNDDTRLLMGMTEPTNYSVHCVNMVK